MQKQQAINIVRETFESSFDKGRYTNFIKNLLNEPDLTDGFGPRSGNYIPDAFKGYVEKYERLGKYTDQEDKRIDILIVYLKRETSIERARSMQRNFVAGYLQGKFGSDVEKDAALVAFVSPNGAEDWRFSLVKLEVKIETDAQGKNKVIDAFTPAKRWSFLVGRQEKSHTAQRQFVPIMQDTDNNPTLAQLEEAFNIETVTKEFFNAYRALFIRTKDELDKLERKDAKVKADFERKGIDTVNLAKKLLGQIVFLYYLQKKGWFGVPRDAEWGEGSRHFLRELFEGKHSSYTNFFNDILEPLFYEALRIDRSHDDHYYSRFNCKIPFLNGGLFDPMNNYDWVRTDILLPNNLFSHRTKDDPEGDGILDVFDLYNFTVKEDEPFEKEVAIDPELLGKAYEKFNAIRPDNYDEFLKALKSGRKGDESKFNKQYGVYYTPREIVHYMCQQSLINYLHSELNSHVAHQSLGSDQYGMFGNEGKTGQFEMTTEQAVEEFSREDIALLIQRGEQWRENEERVDTVGKETETYSYKIPESIRKNAALIDEKLASIKVCDPAVGSGAFPVGMMSEIVKARQVLTIYIRPDRSSKESDRETSVSAQAFRLAGGSMRPVRSAYLFKRECIENSLYGVDIDSGAVEIAKLRLWLSLVVDEDDPQNIKPLPNLDYKIVCGNSLVGVEKNLFNLGLFTELESLKPLYFNATVPSKKQEYKKKIDMLINQITNGHTQFDFEIYFSEVFHEKKGFDIIIANPPYLFSAGREYREYLNKNFSLVQYQTDYYVFFIEAALNRLHKKGILSYIISDSWLNSQNFSKLRNHLLSQHHILAVAVFDFLVFENVALENSILLLSSKDSPSDFPIVRFSTADAYSVSNSLNPNEAIERNMIDPHHSGKAADLLKKIEQGSVILESLTKINRGIHAYRTDGYGKTKFGKGYQTKQDKETESYHSNRPLDKTYLPEIKGKDVFRYYFSPTGKFISYGDWLAEPRERGYFYEPKLTVRKILGDRLHGSFIEQPYALDQSLYVIISKSSNLSELKVILGILLSGLGAWYLRTKYAIYDELYPWYTKKQLADFPIKLGNTKQIEKLVERVLAAKGKNPQADTSKEEAAIDEMVYQLYGLTEEEVKIVEGKS